MLGKSSKPVIEILNGSSVSGNRAGSVDISTSPRYHMEPKNQSPRGLKNFDFGGVGLAIVAALEKSGGIPNQIPANRALFGRNLSRTDPMPINSPRNSSRKGGNSDELMDMESFEEYTIVTCHVPNKSYTKVYNGGVDKAQFRIQNSIKSNRASVFHISPAKIIEPAGAPAPDFLSACNLCQKELHGKDIYMYRGEKAFCSTECRYKQMVVDERKEKCRSEASRPMEIATSPYANGQILTTGILAI